MNAYEEAVRQMANEVRQCNEWQARHYIGPDVIADWLPANLYDVVTEVKDAQLLLAWNDAAELGRLFQKAAHDMCTRCLANDAACYQDDMDYFNQEALQDEAACLAEESRAG